MPSFIPFFLLSHGLATLGETVHCLGSEAKTHGHDLSLISSMDLTPKLRMFSRFSENSTGWRDRVDAGAAEAVIGADGEVQVTRSACLSSVISSTPVLADRSVLGWSSSPRQGHEGAHVLAVDDVGGVDHGIAREAFDGAVGLDLGDGRSRGGVLPRGGARRRMAQRRTGEYSESRRG